jgi:trimeric autotransporter adhesin
MRYEPNAISPNVIGGSPVNNVTAGVRGATIAGGGVPPGNTDPNAIGEAPNP